MGIHYKTLHIRPKPAPQYICKQQHGANPGVQGSIITQEDNCVNRILAKCQVQEIAQQSRNATMLHYMA